MTPEVCGCAYRPPRRILGLDLTQLPWLWIFILSWMLSRRAEFSIAATGRDAERCGRLEDNLVLETYKGILVSNDLPIVPLAIKMHNGIPLAMGCGSSAAGRLAAIALAVHFGQLAWSAERIVHEAYLLEGHPDNVAACWLGGFVAAASDGEIVRVAQVVPPAEWRVIVVLPADPLPTSKARAVLPASYPLSDVVANIQAVSMLGLAFAQGRADLLRTAMSDRIHQPYRAPICTLLPLMLPLVGEHGILGAALSGAGPAVLVVVAKRRGRGARLRRRSGARLEALARRNCWSAALFQVRGKPNC